MAENPDRLGRPVPGALDLRARRIPPGSAASPERYSGASQQPGAGPGGPAPDLEALRMMLSDAQFNALLKNIRHQGHLIMKPIVVGTTAINLLPQQQGRYYLLIVNTSAANRMFIGVDFIPSANLGLPLEIDFGFWEPLVVPDNEINVIGAGANTTGVCLYASL